MYVREKIEIECRVRYSIKYDNRLIDWYGVVEKIHDRRVGTGGIGNKQYRTLTINNFFNFESYYKLEYKSSIEFNY